MAQRPVYPKKRMRVMKRFRWRGKLLEVGDTFEADPRRARFLEHIRRAEYVKEASASPVPPTPAPRPENLPAPDLDSGHDPAPEVEASEDGGDAELPDTDAADPEPPPDDASERAPGKSATKAKSTKAKSTYKRRDLSAE
jgi:hypothetical protein